MLDNVTLTEEQRKAFTDLAIEMHKATEEAMNEAFKVTGWHYRDINWMKVSDFDQMLEIFGVDNYKVITSTVRDDWEGGPFRRGQYLISPQGMENLKDWNNKRVGM